MNKLAGSGGPKGYEPAMNLGNGFWHLLPVTCSFDSVGSFALSWVRAVLNLARFGLNLPPLAGAARWFPVAFSLGSRNSLILPPV